MSTTQHHKGFTLVETLVAITILLLTIVGPLTVAQKGIQQARFASEQTTATFLAQEAIEAAREMRDESALDAFDDPSGDDTWEWYTRSGGGNIRSECKDNPDANCTFDNSRARSNRFIVCSDASACKLEYDEDSNRYVTRGGDTDSPFTRKVYFDELPDHSAVKVDVVVSWQSQVFGGATKEVRLQTWIYDQYQRYEN